MAHTSYERLRDALREFAGRKEAGAFLLQGKWGVGKTFACKKALEGEEVMNGEGDSPDVNTQRNGVRSLPRHCYVSLYGLSKSEEIYSRIAWAITGGETVRKVSGEVASAVSSKLKSILGLVEAVSIGFMTKNMLVIIDDLERRDEKLTVKAVMGAVSHLIESQNCRVIFICNEGELQGGDLNQFNEQKEKIFDIEYSYAPNIKENAELVVEGDSTRLEYLLPPLEQLNVCNIRVIRLVDRLLCKFKVELSGASHEILDEVLRDVAILGVLYYGFRSKVCLEDRKNYSLLKHLAKSSGSTETESQKLFSEVWYHPSPFDDEIAKYLESGSINWEALRIRVKDIDLRTSVERRFNATTRRVFKNFEDNGEELIAELTDLCENHTKFIEPSSLKFASQILVALRKTDRFKVWLEKWAKEVLPSLDSESLRTMRRDMGPREWPSEVATLIENETISRSKDYSLTDVMNLWFRQMSLDPDKKEWLRKRTKQDYLEWMLNDDDSYQNIRSAFEIFGHSPKDYSSVMNSIKEALQDVKETSDINRYRVDKLLAILPIYHHPDDSVKSSAVDDR